jgi:hypothetical protein
MGQKTFDDDVDSPKQTPNLISFLPKWDIEDVKYCVNATSKLSNSLLTKTLTPSSPKFVIVYVKVFAIAPLFVISTHQ